MAPGVRCAQADDHGPDLPEPIRAGILAMVEAIRPIDFDRI
jgi:hypothetical protein